MSMSSQIEKAEKFRSLHNRKRILVLPNAWDVPSARVFEDEGFPAVATSSAGMMVSIGFPDGESIGPGEFLSAVRRIARVLTVPLSADIVGGFGHNPIEVGRMVTKVVAAGAVGINIEDFVHQTGRLLPVEKQLVKLRQLKKLSSSLETQFVINARTDAYRFGEGDEESKFEEAVRRARAYRDVGVDCVYPMGLTTRASITSFVKALDFPVNVMVRKGLPSVGELEKIGVARVSFGPSASYAAMGLLKHASREVLGKGTYHKLVEGAITFDELNALALPIKSKKSH